ncbi:MAG TPA: chlorite dismutase family protein [Polyangiales bacterium]|jgi:chlorite dismutase|nr:chlorite dismutase family protein [Polyangiales bacterium]
MSEDKRTDELPIIDVAERAGVHTGKPQELQTRLFMQLMVFSSDSAAIGGGTLRQLGQAIEAKQMPAVIYEDVNDARGIGVLSWSEDPSHFVTRLRPALQSVDTGLRQRHEFSMLGRTYATGYETDLRFWLLDRPRQTVLNPSWPWAIWYPLRRVGPFARLDPHERGAIMSEHGKIGRAYGAQDLAHDVRLACYGLDTNDNEFVIGLVGKELHPLSHVVESMRRTRQTAEFMQQMGPFFVGHAALRVG